MMPLQTRLVHGVANGTKDVLDRLPLFYKIKHAKMQRLDRYRNRT